MLMNARSVNRQIDCSLITRKRNCRAAPPVLCTMQPVAGGQERTDRNVVAIGIAEPDREIGEGILEWIQVPGIIVGADWADTSFLNCCGE